MYVNRIATSAIKGFGLYHPGRAGIGTAGIEGDRAFFLVDRDGSMSPANVDGRLFPWWSRFDTSTETLTIGQGVDVLYEGRTFVGDSPVRARFFRDRYQDGHEVTGAWSQIISDLAGEELHLIRPDGGLGGQDVGHVSLLALRSASDLGREGDGLPLDPDRFRMNLWIDDLPAFEEDTWIGRSLTVGGARLAVFGGASRCSMVERRHGDSGRNVRVLEMLARRRGATPRDYGFGLMLGVYARVDRPGPIAVGDSVELTDPGKASAS